jgi:mono/diheme cytochrome c family protein
MKPALHALVGVIIGFACLAALGIAQDAAAPGERLFPEKIAPLLQKHCVGCHNADKARGGLDLTGREALLEGGDKGQVIVAGDAKKSRLYEMIAGPTPKMPRQADPLPADDVALVARWIDSGAPWPAGLSLATKITDAETWWSFRPLRRPPLPQVNDPGWCRTPIDYFILAKLEAKGMKPSLPGDPLTFLRRVKYDLHGLPPTPEEIDEFLRDCRAAKAQTSDDGLPNTAVARLVDRLLASPHFGERWGRHWLDIVHYADTHGYDKDKRRLWAWLYRDWVIRAFNRDLPFRRFIRYQLAGDVLLPNDPDGVIATGFVVAGPWDFVGHVELREGTVDKEKTRALDRDDMVSNTIATFNSLTVHCARCHEHKFDPIPMRDYYQLQAVFAGVERGDRPLTTKDNQVYAVRSIQPRPIHVLARGDVERPGKLVQAGALSTIFPKLGDHFADARAAKPQAQEGARRAALANWLCDDDNALTWRSIVNRVWHYHFGKGIVDTPNDFGKNGGLPSHPELLDWLACEFRDADSLKRLHKMIVMSAAYRQSSTHNADYAKRDSDNRWLWRMNRLRLDAESIRDSVLAVSGKLRPQMYGPGYDLFRFKDDHSPIYDHLDVSRSTHPDTWRRTAYRFVVRSVPNPFLETLDCADPNINVPVRNTTVTALQALALLNNPFMLQQAEFFAERVRKMESESAKQVDAAYRLAFGRLPTPTERADLVRYAERHGLANACRLLFNANEFMFVD